MKLYKIGKVVSTNKTYIILETNNMGEIIYTSKPEEFLKGKVQKVWLYEYNTDYINNTFGFRTFEERLFFTNIITVPTIGPKTALAIMKEDIKSTMALIAKGDIETLSKLPSLGKGTAEKVVITLKDKYNKYINGVVNNSPTYQIKDSLKVLGFNNEQINYAIKNVKPQDNLELMVEEAIKVISNAKNFASK